LKNVRRTIRIGFRRGLAYSSVRSSSLPAKAEEYWLTSTLASRTVEPCGAGYGGRAEE
jgi:hypothetical protein